MPPFVFSDSFGRENSNVIEILFVLILAYSMTMYLPPHYSAKGIKKILTKQLPYK